LSFELGLRQISAVEHRDALRADYYLGGNLPAMLAASVGSSGLCQRLGGNVAGSPGLPDSNRIDLNRALEGIRQHLRFFCQAWNVWVDRVAISLESLCKTSVGIVC